MRLACAAKEWNGEDLDWGQAPSPHLLQVPSRLYNLIRLDVESRERELVGEVREGGEKVGHYLLPL